MNKKQKRFIQWLLTPTGERQPKTQEELAGELNCRPSTLKRWFNLPEFKQALEAEIQYQVELQVAGTYQVLIQKAMDGDFRSIKELLNKKDPYPPPTAKDASQEGYEGPFTYEEYQQARKNIKEWEDREFGQDDRTDLD